MQFRPKRAIGFEINDEIAAQLELSEQYENWKTTKDALQFNIGLEEKYGFPEGPEAMIWDFQYERGGEIQGLQGFEWNKTYCWFFGGTKVKGWKGFENKLKKKGVCFQSGAWSELG